MSAGAKVVLALFAVFALILIANWPRGEARSVTRAMPALVVGPALRGNTHWETILTVENQTEPRGFRLIGLDCTFFWAGTPVDTGGTVATNVAYGQRVYVKKRGPYSERSVDRVECRVDYAHPN